MLARIGRGERPRRRSRPPLAELRSWRPKGAGPGIVEGWQGVRILAAGLTHGYDPNALKSRAVLLVALLGTAGSAGACNAIVGNTTLSEGDSGSEAAARSDASHRDATSDDVNVAADVRTEADVGTDSANPYSKFCTNLNAHLASMDAHVVFCDDF